MYEICGSINLCNHIFTGIFSASLYAEWKMQLPDAMFFGRGIPFGRGYLFIPVILKGYDTVGIMAILFLDMAIAGVIGGTILTFRLLMATGYPAGAMTADIAKMAKLDAENDRVR